MTAVGALVHHHRQRVFCERLFPHTSAADAGSHLPVSIILAESQQWPQASLPAIDAGEREQLLELDELLARMTGARAIQ